MKNFIKKPLHTFLIAGFMFFIMSHANLAKQYAFLGLNTWFNQMVPSLIPFMILSGLLIQLDLISLFCKPFRFCLRPIFRMNDSCLYVLITGFVCGFPMGAKNIVQLYQNNQLTKDESEYLLAFTNNIGPIYFFTFVWNNIYSAKNHPHSFFLMFIIPLLYGIFLRYSLYRNKIRYKKNDRSNPSNSSSNKNETSFIDALDTSIVNALVQIAILGGYMIFFNLVVFFPAIIFKENPYQCFLHSLIEISGGLQAIKGSLFQENQKFLLAHLALSFNGLCCLFQTLHFIKATNLSGQKYMLHKLILCSISLILILFFHL